MSAIWSLPKGMQTRREHSRRSWTILRRTGSVSPRMAPGLWTTRCRLRRWRHGLLLHLRASCRRFLMSRHKESSPGTFAIAGIAVFIAQTTTALADPQSVPNSTEANTGTDFRYGADYNGLDMTRPERAYFEMRSEDRTSGTTRSVDTQALRLRGGGAVSLGADWKFGWLSEIPLINETTVTPMPFSSSREFGIGDAVFQGVLSRPINERWGYGFGARLIAPTAEDSLGSGRWQIMPGFGVRYSFLEFGDDTYFVPKMRYAVSLRSTASQSQRAANRTDSQYRPSGSVVRDVLSFIRHPHQLRRSSVGPDWTFVPSVRRRDRTKSDRQGRHRVGDGSADSERLPSVQF